jgi:hypothetical protein
MYFNDSASIVLLAYVFIECNANGGHSFAKHMIVLLGDVDVNIAIIFLETLHLVIAILHNFNNIWAKNRSRLKEFT